MPSSKQCRRLVPRRPLSVAMGLPATFGEILSEEKSPSRAKPARSTKVFTHLFTRPTPSSRSQVRHVLQRAYHEREGRKEGRKEGVNVLIGKRKEDVEVEEVKEGRVTAEDYCRQWLRVDRGQCARRGVHTIRCLDLARRRVDEAAKHGVGSRRAPSRRRCCPSVLFNTSHLSISHSTFHFY